VSVRGVGGPESNEGSAAALNGESWIAPQSGRGCSVRVAHGGHRALRRCRSITVVAEIRSSTGLFGRGVLVRTAPGAQTTSPQAPARLRAGSLIVIVVCSPSSWAMMASCTASKSACRYGSGADVRFIARQGVDQRQFVGRHPLRRRRKVRFVQLSDLGLELLLLCGEVVVATPAVRWSQKCSSSTARPADTCRANGEMSPPRRDWRRSVKRSIETCTYGRRLASPIDRR